MKLRKKNVLLTVMLGILFFSVPLTTQGFATVNSKSLSLLKKVHEPEWEISYSFLADCPEAFKQQEKELKRWIEEALQAWLQPLRKWYPDRAFTNTFHFIRRPDVVGCNNDQEALGKFDLNITFDCRREGWSFLRRGWRAAPDICITGYDNINRRMLYVLVHEIGHAFGLEDTYVDAARPSTGGLPKTWNKQPSSVMAGYPDIDGGPFVLGVDDRNGIIWLYKRIYEDHPARDCLFPDYISPKYYGCEPRYPLIFEAKNGHPSNIHAVLRHDPTIDINARDNWGNTALHYAVQRASNTMIDPLMARADIKVNLANNSGRTPAQLARDLKLQGIAKRISRHSTAKLPLVPWAVAPGAEKLTTMWAQLKQRN